MSREVVVLDPETGQIIDPASLEDDVERMRAAATPLGRSDGVVRGPDWVIEQLEAVSSLAGHMVRVLWQADKVRAAARRALARATAQATQQAVGKTVAERAAEVTLAIEDAQETSDIAEIAYNYAKATARLIEERKSAVQTISRQVEITYQLAGSRRAA